MKRRYQIEQQRAVNEFRQLATNQNPNIQMVLPMAEIVGLLQQGVGHLLREAGLALMSLVMEEEVRHLAGERSPAARGPARPSLGSGGWLLRDRWAESADPENATAEER
jgi:hypothetical protein